MTQRPSSTTMKVPVEALEYGMFVSRLDRPWLQTPFLVQGFHIRHEAELTQLRELCEYVWVDSATLPEHSPPDRAANTVHRPTKPSDHSSIRRGQQPPITQPFEDELPTATSTLANYSQTVEETFESLGDGRNLDLNKIRKATGPIIDSMVANPDAMMWLARMKSKSDYAFKHALCVSVWSVALGRQLGLPKQELIDLSIGGMLSDMGKLWIDQDILNKASPLSVQERESIREHVNLGLDALTQATPSGPLPDNIRSAILHHHERHQGQGYPNQLSASEIPLFARIVGIADCYDALTSQRPYAKAVSSGEALKQLYSMRDMEFQAELIEEFIQAIGLYPAGSIVQLSDGSTAIVVCAGRTQRLKPRVIIAMTSEGTRVRKPVIIDLAKDLADDHGRVLEIVRSVPSGEQQFDLDDFYL